MHDTPVKLNHRQIAFMLCVILTAGGELPLTKAIVSAGKIDGWFAEILPMLYGLLIAGFYVYLYRLYPGQNLFQISRSLAGKWGGALINLVFVTHIWLIIVRDVAVLSDFLSTTLLLRTPVEMIILLYMCVAIYYMNTSVEITSRVNDLMFPLYFLSIVLLPLLLSNELELSRIEPILGHGFAPVLKANYLSYGWFADIVVVGAFFNTIKQPRQLLASLRFGVVLAGFLLTLLMLVVIVVLGSSVTGRLMYPNYTLVEQIHITDFLDRMELMVFSIWLPALFLKITFIMQSFLAGVNALTGNSKNALYGKQIGWFLMLTTIVSFQSISEAFAFGNYGAAVFFLFLHLPIYAMLLLLARWKERKKLTKSQQEQKASEEPHPTEKAQKKSAKQKLPWYVHTSQRTWMWWTNGLLLLAAGVVLAGTLFGDKFIWIGWIGGGLYAVCLLGALFTSYIEMRRTQHTEAREAKIQKADAKTA
ncbi:MAG TPA: endospore germination permease [Bacilli bacterium]|nr:endospore germination permease [Bacilli bacterium]